MDDLHNNTVRTYRPKKAGTVARMTQNPFYNKTPRLTPLFKETIHGHAAPTMNFKEDSKEEASPPCWTQALTEGREERG